MIRNYPELIGIPSGLMGLLFRIPAISRIIRHLPDTVNDRTIIKPVERLPEFITNHLILATLFIAILSMLIWNIFGTAMAGVSQLNPMEVTRLMNQEKAILIDVRTADDYASGHILNAINIPGGELENRKKELEKHKKNPVVLYCSHGNDSVKAGRILKYAGYENIFALKAGLESWRSANLPITRD